MPRAQGSPQCILTLRRSARIRGARGVGVRRGWSRWEPHKQCGELNIRIINISKSELYLTFQDLQYCTALVQCS